MSPGSPLSSCFCRLPISLFTQSCGKGTKWYVHVTPNFPISSGNQSPTVTSQQPPAHTTSLGEREDTCLTSGQWARLLPSLRQMPLFRAQPAAPIPAAMFGPTVSNGKRVLDGRQRILHLYLSHHYTKILLISRQK